MSNTSSIEYFKSNFLSGGLAKPNRYQVIIEGTAGGTINMPAETISLPSRGFVTMEEQWYGPPRQVPIGRKYDSSVIISFPVSRDQSERTFFEDWMDNIVSPENNRMNYNAGVVESVMMKIQTLDELGEITSTYELTEAYPSSILPTTLGSSMRNDYTRIQIQFEYREYTYTAGDGTTSIAGAVAGAAQSVGEWMVGHSVFGW